MMTPEEMTIGMHNAGFTNFNYAEHCTLFLNGKIFMSEWPSSWGTPPTQAVINSW